MARAQPPETALAAIEKLDEIMDAWRMHGLPITYGALVEVRALMETGLCAAGAVQPHFSAAPPQGGGDGAGRAHGAGATE